MNVKQAIARSINHNEIVTLPYSAEAEEELLVTCEDFADSDHMLECWGMSGDCSWRVHLEF